MTGTAVVSTDTGEVMPSFELEAYLKTLNPAGQNQLAAAYDAACRALLGPNDVQVEGNREFKKKSAWRKLARHFGISVEVVKIEREVIHLDQGPDIASHFLATVTARARAPWGQSYEEVGACCTDEARGRREITVADAIATASTRASNRAVSNLIAMGEVSAEEIGDRPAQPAPKATGPVWPFGDKKGIPLTAMSTDDLKAGRLWAEKKDPAKFARLIEQLDEEMESRREAAPA